MTVHPGELTTVMYEVVNTQNARGAGAGDSELCAAVGDAAFQEGRVLLLQAADPEAERSAADAGGVLHRPGAAARCEDHHACRTRSSRSAAPGSCQVRAATT